jgi:hypothetical protein
MAVVFIVFLKAVFLSRQALGLGWCLWELRHTCGRVSGGILLDCLSKNAASFSKQNGHWDTWTKMIKNDL